MYHMCTCVYNLYMKLLSHKKNEIFPFVTWVYLQGIKQSEISQT